MPAHIIENIRIEISKQRVMARFSQTANAELPPKIEKLYDTHLAQMMSLCAPKIIYEIFSTTVTNRTVKLGNVAEFHSESLSKLLTGCRSTATYAVTIDDLLEKKCEYFSDQQEYLRSHLFDCFGSEYCERTADSLSSLVKQKALLERKKPTIRFSPGYGDLPVEANIDILEILDAAKIGIIANEFGYMTPRKSTAGFIGLSDDAV
jgi:hypothetical protein